MLHFTIFHNVSLSEMPTKASNKRNQKGKVLKLLHVAIITRFIERIFNLVPSNLQKDSK